MSRRPSTPRTETPRRGADDLPFRRPAPAPAEPAGSAAQAITTAPASEQEPVRSQEPPPPTSTLGSTEPLFVKVDNAPRAGLGFLQFVIFTALAWPFAVVGLAVSQRGPSALFGLTPDKLIGIGVFAAAPTLLIIALGLAVHRAGRLGEESARAKAMVDAMAGPALLAAGRTRETTALMLEAIREAERAATATSAQMTTMRSALQSESQRLNEAAKFALQAAQRVAEQLRNERLEMGKLGETLDKQSKLILSAVDTQARMLSEASNLAQVQLTETETVLSERTQALATVTHDVINKARGAADDLGRQAVRLETAGSSVVDNVKAVEDGLAQQRLALTATADSLRADQAAFGKTIEERRSQISEALSHTRAAAADLSVLSSEGAEALKTLVEAASEQFNAAVSQIDLSQAELESRTRQTLERFALMAAETRAELIEETERATRNLSHFADEARRSADMAAAAAQARVDGLSEVLFDSARQADDSYEARIQAARRLIDDGVSVIEHASDRMTERLSEHLVKVRALMSGVEQAISDLDQRAERLPEEARARIDALRSSAENAINSVLQTARRAADETQAVDNAFQDRVKRNYVTLTEAVRMLDTPAAPLGASADRRVSPPLQPRPPEPAPKPAEAPKSEYRQRLRTVSPTPEPPAPVRDEPRLTPEDLGFRTRPSPARAPEPEPAAPAAKRGESVRDNWTWQELLNQADPAPPPTEAEPERRAPVAAKPQEPPRPAPKDLAPQSVEAAPELLTELEALGLNVFNLMPRARVEEAAEALNDDDFDTARQVIRRVAPAAVRRLSRRLLTESSLRQLAEQHVRQCQALTSAASRRGDPEAVYSLLETVSGRAFLLIDAAIGDVL